MEATLRLAAEWPAPLVHAVRGVREACAWASRHSLAGLPLEWLVRLVLITLLYLGLRAVARPRFAAVACLLVLTLKESFDIFAHLDLLRPRVPDWATRPICSAARPACWPEC